MALHSFTPNSVIESAKVNANFTGLANGTEIEAAAITPDKMNFGASAASVSTAQTTTSTSYTDLATAGPSVTVTIPSGGAVLIAITVDMTVSVAEIRAEASWDTSGANTVTATTQADTNFRSITVRNTGANTVTGSGIWLVTGLTAGSTTFKLQYRTQSNTATFSRRSISVIPIGD